MLARLVVLFLVTPAVELALLLKVGQLIGFWETVGIIVATGIAGSFLAKREGVSAWQRLNRSLARGGLPGKELLDGVIILIAGALLITPGVLTDIVGFMGLLPPSRALIRKLIMKRVQKKMEDGSLNMQFGFFGGVPSGGRGGTPDGPSGPAGGPGGNPAGDSGPSPRPNGPKPSERKREREPGWEGTPRQRPGHIEESGESSS
ncbi:hypothetical protein CRI94_02235 [Longibacter salinarum]|uniref:Exlusion protein FxsA n=1 Tax=Longibacter salinarum TaxID=1850348 RepID=A0A2A8D2G5_9BACT|nr:FxsA family protein [Longibacter salinarum]PEN15129.1 hypothetical protein CRI94_02235 [Longibacter salinarum]